MAPAVAMVGIAAAGVSARFGTVVKGWMLFVCLGFWAFSVDLWGGQGAILAPSGLGLGVLTVGLVLAWRRWRVLAGWRLPGRDGFSRDLAPAPVRSDDRP
jgi:hypothetical protein